MPEERFWKFHRIVMAAIAVAIVATMALSMNWSWLPKYAPDIIQALWITVALLVSSIFAGMLLAIPIGLVQVTGPWPLAWLANGFCTLIRGTPILLQMWVLYYGLVHYFLICQGCGKAGI